MTDSVIARRLTIAVLTYRRPNDLADLLPILQTQIEGVAGEVDILVVDNDPHAGARTQVMTEARHAPIRYVHEPSPGIAAARNRALDETVADLLVFIDDDERPTAAWLNTLLATYERYRPVAVVGAVVSRYDTPPSRWVQAGRFFDRRRLPTGTPVTEAATNNLLIDLAWVRARGLRFDGRFGLSGGSDSLFTRQVHALGGLMTWCDEAVVIDVVPASRVTRSWVLRRAYRIGNASSRVRLDAATPGRRLALRVALLARGSARLLAGSARCAAGFLTGQLVHRARGMRTVARGAGMLSGSLGATFSEYSRT